MGRYQTCSSGPLGTGRGFSSEADLSIRKSKHWPIWIGLGVLLALATPGNQALASPLDLQDPTPRWIEVRFEVSPKDEPGRLDGSWSDPRAAFLESDPDHSIVRIRIPTHEIETHFRTTDTEAIPGSFSDFVWTLDSATGHVLSARLTGRVRERLSVGPIRTSVAVAIRVEMTTREVAGFRPNRGIFGVRTNTFCVPSPRSSDCIPVTPIRFDPDSGYVNAVGSVVASAAIAEIRAFSPLGEVRFSEKGPAGTETVVSGTSQPNAVCSEAFDGPCWANLGGES